MIDVLYNTKIIEESFSWIAKLAHSHCNNTIYPALFQDVFEHALPGDITNFLLSNERKMGCVCQPGRVDLPADQYTAFEDVSKLLQT